MSGILHLTIAAVCISCIPCALADLERHCFSDEPQVDGGSCGSELSDLVTLICGPDNHDIPDMKRSGYYRANPWGHFRSIALGKRDTGLAVADKKSQWEQTVKALDQTKRNNIAKLRNKMLTKRSAYSYLTSSISRQGIVCECCYYPCGIYELSQYCFYSSFLRK